MKKIVFVIPYFGNFPEYFELFLKSCAANPTIDWLLFTDTKEEYIFPENVKRVLISFEQLRNLIEMKMGFKIALSTPYKLCDYKPAYGFIFSEYICNYDYWGYCDIDLIFGDIRCFFPDNQLEKYDKIGHLGHMSLFRNTEYINLMFKKEVYGMKKYQEVYTSDRIFVFDEWGDTNINLILKKEGKRVWYWNNFWDVYPYKDNLRRVTT